MIEFNVSSMSCGHCVAAVTSAIKSVDANARVDVDLTGKRVRVESDARTEVLRTALIDAGYRPEGVNAG